MIEIRNLTKVHPDAGRTGPVTALDGVDLSVAAGEVYGVVGRSGTGKSTLIRCVNLLERPSSGSVSVAGRELTGLWGRRLRAERRRIGMVFQRFNLLAGRTARENVELPLEIGGTLTRRGRRAKADRRIAESETISELLTRDHSELAWELFSLGPAPLDAGLPETTVLEVTFHGDATAQPLVSQLARTYSIDVTILGAALETVNGQTAGWMRIGLPGRFEDNVVQIGFLRERGLKVETVGVRTAGAVLEESVS